MSNPGRRYWVGNELATLKLNDFQVTAFDEHFHARGQKHRTVFLMNFAFETFYRMRELIRKIPDGQVKNAAKQDFESVARTGWGWGIDDIEEAFDHIAKKQGRWTDGTYATWHTNTGKLVPEFDPMIDEDGALVPNDRSKFIVYGLQIPSSIASFLEAVAASAGTARMAWSTMEREIKGLERDTGSGDFLELPVVGSPEWDRIGLRLEKIGRAKDILAPVIWLGGAVSEFVDEAADVAGNFLGACGDVKGALDGYRDAKLAGFDDKTATGFVAMQAVMSKALPVIGDYFASALALIPSTAAGITEVAEKKRSVLAAATGRDFYPQN